MSETILEKFEKEKADRDLFGFWMYLMSDLITFAALFATFAVLRNNTAGGPTAKELFSINGALLETGVLLLSSFTTGLMMVSLQKEKKNQVLGWLGTTFVLGFVFLVMEMMEFGHMFTEGAMSDRSAFLSSFFGLVGTHGLHIVIGLLWMFTAGILVWKRDLTEKNKSNLSRLSLFWHFLDIVWIFIFTVVYLVGVI